MTFARNRNLVALAAGLTLAGAIGATPDPTRPPGPEEIRAWRDEASGQARAAWRLESVLISERRRVAVINGHTVGVGDTVDQARVTAISPGGVRLEADGESVELTLERQARSDNNRQDR